MWKTLLFGAVLLSMAACVEDPIVVPVEPQVTGPGAPMSQTAQAECAEKGGAVVVGMGGPVCATPTPDAGKACTKASDCSGSCMAETMTCSKVTPQFGCYDVVMEDGQTAGLCVD